MTWETLLSNLTAAQRLARARFPHLAEDAIRFAQSDMTKFAEHLAATHDLTVAEARDEIQNWLVTLRRSQLRQAA